MKKLREWIARLFGRSSPSDDLGEVAFDETIVSASGDYRFKATYLEKPKGESLIEIWHNGEPVKEFHWPSYKIWNILAHAGEIMYGLEQGNDAGLHVAGSDLLGENAYQPEAADD